MSNFLISVGIIVIIGFIAYIVNECWRLDREKRIEKIIPLTIALISTIATLYVANNYSQNSEFNNYCERVEGLANDIVVMLPPLTETVTEKIGIPDICHHRDGTDTPMPASFVEPVKTFWSDRSIYLFKRWPLLRDKRILDANNAYEDAIGQLFSQCKSNPDFDPIIFQKKQSIVRDASNKFVDALGLVLADCYVKNN